MFTLHNGDCLEYMKSLPDGAVEAVITDPPYGVKIAEWDKFAPPSEVLTECLRVASGCVLWFGGAHPESMKQFLAMSPDRVLIWHVTFSLNPAVTHGIYYKWHPIYCWRLPKQKVISRDVLEYPTAKNNGYDHPAKKPQDLMEHLVSAFSESSVLDPFMGSGTTGAACMKLSREFIGCELDPKYFAMAEKRIKQAVLSPSFFTPSNNRLQPTAFGVGTQAQFPLLGSSQADESSATNGGG